MSRTVRIDHLTGVFRPGSGDWSWPQEFDNLAGLDSTRELIVQISRDGIKEPVLLGSDGRVWDGHHRIVAAMHIGIDMIPVKFSGEEQNDG